MTTLNISLPTNLYKDIKKTVKERGYSSVSELMRDAIRRILYPELTENGFTPEFEEAVLRSTNEPLKKDIVFNTDEDINKHFEKLHKRFAKIRHGKNPRIRRIPSNVNGFVSR